MIGVLLAGGNGTRLSPVTSIYNKHVTWVYGQPMFIYPLFTLLHMGCTEIYIVSTKQGVEQIKALIENMQLTEDGLKVRYFVQPEPLGIADAFNHIPVIKGLFPVILGDNYFVENIEMPDRPTIYVKDVPDPERFGVYQDGEIFEKPENPKTSKAVTGLYVFDERVFAIINQLKYSARGELEVTDINNWYLKTEAMQVKELYSYWSDMGTHDSLLEVANWIRDL